MEINEMRILIVEDEFDSSQVVSTILGFNGATVHSVNNGIECLEQIEDFAPTVVIMDLSMPEMDGWDTLAALRANPHTATIPVIATTAYDSVPLARDAREAGFNGYLPKPISPRTLVECLVEVVN